MKILILMKINSNFQSMNSALKIYLFKIHILILMQFQLKLEKFYFKKKKYQPKNNMMNFQKSQIYQNNYKIKEIRFQSEISVFQNRKKTKRNSYKNY